MANVKITNLERSRASNNGDLLLIVQNNVTKTISKNDFIRSLVQDLGNLSDKFSNLQQLVQKSTVKKRSAKFSTAVSGKEPKLDDHLTTKQYVDGQLRGAVKDIKGTQISNILKYSSNLQDTITDAFEIVHKHYVDTQVAKTLKVLSEHSTNSFPAASEGDTFLLTESYANFSNTGVEVTPGDMIICTNTSAGGQTASSDFVILNTNIGFATEESAGLFYKSSASDILNYDNSLSAITPSDLKVEKEQSATYNHIRISSTAQLLEEKHKGIIGVDTATSAVTLTLPAISTLNLPKFCKYIIKDESNTAGTNNITIDTSSLDSIDGAKTYVINTDGGTVEIYNNDGFWYTIGGGGSQSSTTSSGTGIKRYTTDARLFGTTSTSEVAAKTLIEDLSQYAPGEGFKIYATGSVGSNSASKTIKLDLLGSTSVTNTTTGSPTSKSWILEATVLRSQDKGGIPAVVFGHITFDGVAPDIYVNNVFTLDWKEPAGEIKILTDNSDSGDISTVAFILERIKN
tara:strand:- start:630 stop:2174 length:1545 start_codon:yes stop_codon:yes gene_type:complete